MKPIVKYAPKNVEVTAEWGQLTWFANAELGNSEDMTIGRCIIKPGQENPRHMHPNCSEVLVVISGRIAHSLEGETEAELGPGDSITIPPGLPHRARNVGDADAVLWISFSSARREFVPVESSV